MRLEHVAVHQRYGRSRGSLCHSTVEAPRAAISGQPSKRGRYDQQMFHVTPRPHAPTRENDKNESSQVSHHVGLLPIASFTLNSYSSLISPRQTPTSTPLNNLESITNTLLSNQISRPGLAIIVCHKQATIPPSHRSHSAPNSASKSCRQNPKPTPRLRSAHLELTDEPLQPHLVSSQNPNPGNKLSSSTK